jgi:hypothetical protein
MRRSETLKLAKISKDKKGFSNNTPSMPTRRAAVCFAVIVFLWPAIYLCRDIVPVQGTYTAISNDFGGHYYGAKVYLLASIAQKHFPLWCPAEAGGFPFFSNPFAQVFYPPNLLLIPYYALMDGYTLLDYQIFTILGLCIFSLGLFAWLRLIIPNLRAVLIGVLIMSVSFKMTEIVRFTNAVHSAAWYPWILYAITKLFLSKTNKASLLNAALLIFLYILSMYCGLPLLCLLFRISLSCLYLYLSLAIYETTIISEHGISDKPRDHLDSCRRCCRRLYLCALFGRHRRTDVANR